MSMEWCHGEDFWMECLSGVELNFGVAKKEK